MPAPTVTFPVTGTGPYGTTKEAAEGAINDAFAAQQLEIDGKATAAQGEKADTAVQPEELGTAAGAATEDFATAAQGEKADTAVQPEELGTAAGAATEDFATAAQGEKADTAVQPEELGTAAGAATEDFATAAQGEKADTAVQPEELGTAAGAATEDFATAAQGAKADTAVQPGELGTAAGADTGDFATAAQGAKADTAAQNADFYDRAQNTGGRVPILPDGHGGSALDYDAFARRMETPFPLVSRQERQNDGGVFAEVIQEDRTVGGWRGGERIDLVPTHASQRLALLADTHGIQQLFQVSENENLGTNWMRQLTYAPKPITGYDWVRLPTSTTPGLAQITRADQPFTKRRHMLGRVEVPINVPVATTPTYMLFVAVIGQSNSVGAVNPYNNTVGSQLVYDLMLRPHGPLDADLLRFNGGVLPHQAGVENADIATAIDPAQIASLVPLREGDNTNGADRETFMSALALQLNGPAGFDRDRYILTGSFGHGGSTFAELILDTGVVQTPYQNMLDAIQAAQDICDGESLDLEVVVVWDQGEANANTAATDYRDLMTGWHTDLVTRVGAITGQSAVKLFISQTMASRGSAAEPCLSALGQALAADANADIHLLPASYFTDPDKDPYQTPGSYALVHHSATGHQWRGSVYGAAMAQVLVEDSDPSLRILSATWSGSQITITWNQDDVVIDCDTIRNLGTGLGLSHTNSNGATRSVSRVYMSAPNQTVIQLSDDIPAEAVETITVGDTDIVPSGNWILGYANGPRTPFRRREPIGYSMISGEPLFVFANIEEFTATEA